MRDQDKIGEEREEEPEDIKEETISDLKLIKVLKHQYQPACGSMNHYILYERNH